MSLCRTCPCAEISLLSAEGQDIEDVLVSASLSLVAAKWAAPARRGRRSLYGNRAACCLVPMLALSSQKGSSWGGCKGVPGPEVRREEGMPLLTHLEGRRKGERLPGAALRTVRFREGPHQPQSACPPPANPRLWATLLGLHALVWAVPEAD